MYASSVSACVFNVKQYNDTKEERIEFEFRLSAISSFKKKNNNDKGKLFSQQMYIQI